MCSCPAVDNSANCGIGYHWFPQSYVSAVSSSYCHANPQTTEFYSFASEWAKANPAASVPSTTAANILGTQTAASLYYTYASAHIAAGDGSASKCLSLRRVLLVALALGAILYQ